MPSRKPSPGVVVTRIGTRSEFNQNELGVGHYSETRFARRFQSIDAGVRCQFLVVQEGERFAIEVLRKVHT